VVTANHNITDGAEHAFKANKLIEYMRKSYPKSAIDPRTNLRDLQYKAIYAVCAVPKRACDKVAQLLRALDYEVEVTRIEDIELAKLANLPQINGSLVQAGEETNKRKKN
jgi:hypothetical protein